MRIERYARGRNAGVCEKHNSFCASLCPAAQQQKLAFLPLIWCFESLSSNLYFAVNKHYHAINPAVHRPAYPGLVRGTGARIVHVFFVVAYAQGSILERSLYFDVPWTIHVPQTRVSKTLIRPTHRLRFWNSGLWLSQMLGFKGWNS